MGKNKWIEMQQDKFYRSGRDVYKNDTTFERIVESEWDVDIMVNECGCTETRNGYGLLLTYSSCKNHIMDLYEEEE